MSEMPIIRQRLAFEREFGQHRNWWVRDSRLAGTPVSILLYLLSHDPSRMPTQTDSRRELGLGKDAWQSGKRRLLEAGFLVEIRDRYPRGFVDADGRQRGGQRRFRLFLQDPEPGFSVREADAVIVLDEPYEEYIAAQPEVQCGKSALVSKTPDQQDGGKSALAESPYADNPHTAENPQSFIGRENQNQVGLVGSNTSSDQPTHQAVSAREAEIDAALAALHSDLRLTAAQLAREVNGRVDLTQIDIVRAVEETVIRAASRGERVANPAAYAAAVIVRSPEQWALGAEPPTAFEPLGQRPDGTEWEPSVPCGSRGHWWGSDRLPEVERGHCVDCGIARRTVDPAYAELEDELLTVGGGF